MLSRFITQIKIVASRAKQYVVKMDRNDRMVISAFAIGNCFGSAVSYNIASNGYSYGSSVGNGVLAGFIGTISSMVLMCFPYASLIGVSLFGCSWLGQRSYRKQIGEKQRNQEEEEEEE
jgi:hypothetical protein